MTVETLGIAAVIMLVVMFCAFAIILCLTTFMAIPEFREWWESRKKKKRARRNAIRRTATRRTAAAARH